MKHLDVRDLVAGAILMLLGVFVALYAERHYAVGNAERMGPGFFPVVLAWILAGLGLIIALLALRKTVHVLHPPRLAPRSLVAVLASVAAFSLLVAPFGLIPATFALAFVAALAGREFVPRRTVLLGISLGVLAWLIFTVGLQMNIPAFSFPR